MLRIGREQWRMFQERSLELFRQRAREHLRANWPGECELLGPETVEASIRQAFNRGRRYGIEGERDLMCYLNMMYALGFDFDTDPRYPWAKVLLEDTETDAGARMDLLDARVKREIAGGDAG